MSEYKYPYIPPKYYHATIDACWYIRKNRWFHKAIRWAASKYGVDEEELERHVRARQAAGQKGKKGHSAGKKYHWFVVAYHGYNEEGDASYLIHLTVSKGLTADSLSFSYTRKYHERLPGPYHTPIMQFDTYEEATNWALENEARLRAESWFDVSEFTDKLPKE